MSDVPMAGTANGSGKPGPWGPGMTLLFGGVLFISYSMVQGLALLPWVAVRAAAGATPAQLHAAALTGMNLAAATIMACPFMLLACSLLAWVRRGPDLASYLAVRPVRPRTVAGWVAIMLLAGMGLSALNEWFGRPVPEFVAASYASAGYLPLFWAGIAVFAPVAEEVLFRGFLFPGLLASRLGARGTVVVTSLIFALVHGAQYGWFDLAQVGIVGLLFGWARVRTGSIVTPILMHVALNHLALVLYHWESRSGL